MRLLEAFSSSESIVALLSAADGRFIEVNDTFVSITGYRREDVIGKIPAEVGLWRDAEFRAQLWERLRAERRIVDVPAVATCADGHEVGGRLHVEIMNWQGEATLFCLLQILPADYKEYAADRVEGLYRDLYLNALDGIYRSLPRGGLIEANPAMARILGYASPAELLAAMATDASQLYLDAEHAASGYAMLKEHGVVEQVRGRMRRKDGTAIWVSENCRVVPGPDGQPAFYEGSIQDITAQVEAEQALNQAQELYRVLLDNSRDGVFLVQRGKVCFASEALASMLGYSQEELDGFEYLQLVDEADRDAQNQRRIERESGDRELQTFEVRMVRKDGRRILCEVRADAVDYRGDIASTGTLRDVTVERERQRAIEDAERRYRELFESSPVGLFRSQMDGSILEVNPVLLRIFQYDNEAQFKAEVTGMSDIYANPAERKGLIELALKEGMFQHHEMQVRVRGGGVKTVSVSVRVVHDGNGVPAFFAGSVQDLSERIHIEQALARSEIKFRTLVEQSQVGVFVLGNRGITYVNRALADTLGYSEEELLGKSYEELLAPETRQHVQEERNQYFESGVIEREYERCLLHRNGQRIYFRMSLSPVELDGVPHTMGAMVDITRQREAESRLRFHATHDPLTGLPNRALFNRKLADRLAPEERRGRNAYAVIFLDLDGFKWVNDSLGHGAGDRLLLEIARRLENDLLKDVLIARYGGDEFTLLPEGPCDYARAVGIARRVLDLFSEPFLIGGQQVFSSASLGIVLGRPDYESPDQVVRDADTAMYRAKAAGKSGYVVFDEAMHAEARRRLQMETDFRLAFERGEFVLHYQPIVELATGRLVGCESLVRWQHPEQGMLGPDAFLPLAEETGLITDLDSWVLREACRQLADWRRRLPGAANLVVNVNVDEHQVASPDVVEDVFHLLQKHDIEPSRLRLEVTETVFRSGRGHALAQLSSLKSLGVGLAVDDFGTGYSSLESFAASSFDALKIDQIFVRDLQSNPRHRAIVRTIIGFARDLGLLLTAEGIETEEQRSLLQELGCEFGQGYLFAQPLSAEEFEQRL